ncbi:MAG: ribonuclease N [Rhodoferax sp.]|nr:ribonuclease N [Rhodoferax sp.]
MSHSPSLKRVLAGLLAGALLATGGLHARQPAATNAPTLVSLAELPPQAAQTHALILRGGPFPYDKDGSVFGNRERLLPAQKRGYYREYTVPTPALSHRGKRRIVCGGPPRTPDACYYTADHYGSFRKIVP